MNQGSFTGILFSYTFPLSTPNTALRHVKGKPPAVLLYANNENMITWNAAQPMGLEVFKGSLP